MGYRSDVRVLTDSEGFEKMQDIAWKLAEERNLDKSSVLFPEFGEDSSRRYNYYDAQESYLCFGFDFVKWYDGYEDVDLFMDVLKVANKDGVDWQFMRVGEEYDDVEEDCSDNFYGSHIAETTVMTARVEIVC